MNNIKWAFLKITAILVVMVAVLKISLIFLWPFVLAIVIAIVIEPIVKGFIKIGLKRKSSVLLSMFLIFILIGLFSFYIGSYLYDQLLLLIKMMPQIINYAINKFHLTELENFDIYKIINTLESFVPAFKEKIIGTVISTANGLIFITLITLTSIYISFDLDKISRLIKKYISANYYNVIRNIIRSNTTILKVQVKLVLATTIETIIGLIILGIPSPLTLGLICGILDILPIIGTAMVFIILVMYEASMGNIFSTIGLIVLYILLAIGRRIMEVKLMGDNLYIHPAVLIFSLYLGILFYGPWGVIAGPFIIIVIKEILDTFYVKRKVF